jgi:hypothetical protein
VWGKGQGPGDPGKVSEIQKVGTGGLKVPRHGVPAGLLGEGQGWGGPCPWVESCHPQSSGSGSSVC